MGLSCIPWHSMARPICSIQPFKKKRQIIICFIPTRRGLSLRAIIMLATAFSGHTFQPESSCPISLDSELTSDQRQLPQHFRQLPHRIQCRTEVALSCGLPYVFPNKKVLWYHYCIKVNLHQTFAFLDYKTSSSPQLLPFIIILFLTLNGFLSFFFTFSIYFELLLLDNFHFWKRSNGSIHVSDEDKYQIKIDTRAGSTSKSASSVCSGERTVL